MGKDAPDVLLRAVEDDDIELFHVHEQDPDASAMAAFPPRDRVTHATHWERIRRDPGVDCRTILADGQVVGNIAAWTQDGRREVGYWIDRTQWGRGIATTALRTFLLEMAERPLYAHVAAHNGGSLQVLERCGFRHAGIGTAATDDGTVEVVLVLSESAT